jgi:hypothetical protein
VPGGGVAAGTGAGPDGFDGGAGLVPAGCVPGVTHAVVRTTRTAQTSRFTQTFHHEEHEEHEDFMLFMFVMVEALDLTGTPVAPE